MNRKFLAKIIATDSEGLQTISACCSGAKIKVKDIKYLLSNKVFLLSIKRKKNELNQPNELVNSICRFDLVYNVKSKNINQNDSESVLELLTIDFMKNKDDYEINIIFDKNAHIALTTETIEVRLEDQSEIYENTK